MADYIKDAISKVVEGRDLSCGETKQVFLQIMSGEASDAQIASFITALRMKKETAEEITGAAMAMRDKMAQVNSESQTILDTCGTGGTGANTFNISTASSFVAAGCDIKVAKHGNRGISGPCGSADVMEALGVNINLAAEKASQCLREVGIAFLFAPLFHGAMKYAAGPRKEMGIRTIFNILGPLCNPAKATAQVIGVYRADLTELLSQVLKNLKVRHAFVVCGIGPLDEISITEKTKVSELKDNKIRTFYVSPKDFGIKRGRLQDIQGASAKESAQIILDILKGKKGPQRDIVLMNTSAALVAADRANNFKNGVELANVSISSGAALKKLELLKEFSNK